MRNTFFKFMMAFALIFSANTMAKSKIKRVDIEDAKNRAQVAMAIETYDGHFYDISEFSNVSKHRGNIEKIRNNGEIKLKSGEIIDGHSIRYLFVTGQVRARKMPSKGWANKLPADED